MTKEEAIQALNEIFDDSEFSRYEAWYGTAMKMAIEALSADVVSREDYHNLLMASNDIDRALREYQAKDELASVEAAQKWIPTSEKLPEYRKTVLISTSWDVKVACLDSVKEDGTDDYWDMFLDDSIANPMYAVAWMPLPEPYKGGK